MNWCVLVSYNISLSYTNHLSFAKTPFYSKQIIYLIGNLPLWRIFSSIVNGTIMSLANYFLIVSSFFCVYSSKLDAYADGQKICEQSRGDIDETTLKHRAMQGHSFKNYTLSKKFDCHVKCFNERCKCKAYQMRQNRCELLDDDRFSAPQDFLEEKGYTYYDMNREYVDHQVTYASCQFCENRKEKREKTT